MENILAAWEMAQRPLELPVAVKPTYIPARMNAKQWCFTVPGSRNERMPDLLPTSIYSGVCDSANAAGRNPQGPGAARRHAFIRVLKR